MILPTSFPALEEYSIAENENELRDEIANALYLHQSDEFYKRIASDIASKASIVDAYRHAAIKRMDDAAKEDFASVAFSLGLDAFTPLERKIVTENPYYKLLLGLKEKKVGKLRFFTRNYAPYEVFLYDEQYSSASYGLETLPLGYYENGLSFPALEKGNQVWMSLIPHEINTMEVSLKRARGKVLVLGIGLGYYAYMASQKKEVTHLTLVENDPEVIALFKSTLLPLFPHKEKIEIVQGDAVHYYAKHLGEYDHCFVDIYHNEEDGLPLYLEMLPKANESTSFWIESSLLLYFRRYVIGFLEEQYEGYTEEDYKYRGDFPSRLFGALFDATKGKRIETEEELNEFLSLPSLRRLAASLKL